MVDVDRRMNTHAHVAGLKRLSARANKGPVSPSGVRKGCFSFAHFTRSVIDRLRKCQVQIAKGLSDEEIVRIEASFGFTFPPDLRALLQEGLPVGVGFPDWRSAGLQQLRMRLNLPIAGLSYEVARCRFWAKQWGPRPSDTEKAVRIARAALRKTPILVPVYNYCYISSSPSLAGNPVFFVYQKDVSYRGCDLADFFEKEDFITGGSESPVDFTNVDVVQGKAGSLGSGVDIFVEDERTFRVEKPSMGTDCNGEARMDFEAGRNGMLEPDEWRQIEVTDSKGEESWKDLEAWGRNLDALGSKCDPDLKNAETPPRSVAGFDGLCSSKCSPRSADNSPRLIEDAILRHRKLHGRLPSGKDFTMTAPLAAKVSRRIEFWSDFAEKRQSLNGTIVDYLFSPSKVGVDHDRSSLNHSDWDAESLADIRDRFLPQWLANYLDQISTILRKGGWKEEDINEMVGVSSHPLEQGNFFFDKQSVLESLVLHFNLLSDALRRAGWSTEDVAEALDVELSLQEKRPTKIPVQLAARIGKLAEYVAQV